jgi:hypothetical protein
MKTRKFDVKPYDVLQISTDGGKTWGDYCTIRAGEEQTAIGRVLAGEQVLNCEGKRGRFRIVDDDGRREVKVV